jgi:hypothetical protein
VQSQIAKKQAMETPLIKTAMQNLPAYFQMLPEEKDAVTNLQIALLKKDKVARDECAAAVKPVTHTIKIEAVK